NWKAFCSLQVTHHSRNIWFRFLHKTINTRFYIHQKWPQLITHPQCIHCPYFRRNTIDTLDHFNFLCPTKYKVWCHILSTFVDPSLTTSSVQLLRQLLNLRTTINRTHKSVFPTLSTQQICASTLEGLWTSHWRSTFDSTPFTFPIVLAIVKRLLTKQSYEQELTNFD
ncbi:uncharacterized protein B0P05DRAFT_481851, partial [Gilbertella persicaria]|uniref:uncharacterized protein n=1 Tax=Gilbertella persicaria TaxID=101096 RepID=UPI00221F934E